MQAMGVMTIDGAKLLGLLEEIGRTRALDDGESDLVQDIVAHEREEFRWNTRLDLGLLRAATSNGGIARFARRHSITASAAYNRLLRLRKGRERRKHAPRRHRG